MAPVAQLRYLLAPNCCAHFLWFIQTTSHDHGKFSHRITPTLLERTLQELCLSVQHCMGHQHLGITHSWSHTTQTVGGSSCRSKLHAKITTVCWGVQVAIIPHQSLSSVLYTPGCDACQSSAQKVRGLFRLSSPPSSAACELWFKNCNLSPALVHTKVRLQRCPISRVSVRDTSQV